ncbi:MAG: carbohydrate ABC transporter permease [Bacilli bacterium]
MRKFRTNLVERPRVIDYVLVIIAILYVLFPFYILLLTSFMTEQEANLATFRLWPSLGFSTQGYMTVFKNTTGVNIFRSLANTLWIYTPGIIVGLYMSAMSAFAFAKLKFRSKKFMFSVLMFTLMLPNTLAIIAQVIIFDALGWMGTPLPLMIPPMFGNISAVFFLRQYYLTIPNDLIDQAKIDGLTPLGIFNRLMIKISIPALLTQFILMFITSYNDYMGALIFAQNDRYYTLQIALTMLRGPYAQNYPALMAGCVVGMSPLIILYICSQKLLTKGLAITSGLKG